MVGLDGEKMSKSRGNLVLVSQLRARGVDPMAIRLALLAHHYRDDWEWTDDELDAAAGRLAPGGPGSSPAGPDAGRRLLAQVRARDGRRPRHRQRVAAVDEWAAASGKGDSDRAAGDLVADAVAASLGVSLAG